MDVGAAADHGDVLTDVESPKVGAFRTVVLGPAVSGKAVFSIVHIGLIPPACRLCINDETVP
jgi:hypothetical protein